ncbi:TetR/AcrR family transcriptional regulator [Nocardia otitidiscaviarum]|nr:TetR/AcrR family transcriptional regulator [Nocardia otitidiscaviarum]MCP9624896.1 TetR/AcrR family transcriptional regulator [Nocardia otitidiscaviarum]
MADRPGARRAPHRPSRQDAVLDAAVALCAARPIEQVTVAEIATAAGMTPAAVYYHYRSKDEVLLAAVRRFARALTSRLCDEFERSPDVPIGDVLDAMLHWCSHRRDAALVYFVRSPGWNSAVEALRGAHRAEVVVVLEAELARRHGKSSPARCGVAATALSSLLEVAAVAWLTEDAVLANLGRRRFGAEVRAIAEDIGAL